MWKKTFSLEFYLNWTNSKLSRKIKRIRCIFDVTSFFFITRAGWDSSQPRYLWHLSGWERFKILDFGCGSSERESMECGTYNSMYAMRISDERASIIFYQSFIARNKAVTFGFPATALSRFESTLPHANHIRCIYSHRFQR